MDRYGKRERALERKRKVTLERFAPEESLKVQVDGPVPWAAILLNPSGRGGSSFLLGPGGQDYIGNNSYDDTSQVDR